MGYWPALEDTNLYAPTSHDLIEGVSKCMITEEVEAKFNEYYNSEGPHDECYTDASKCRIDNFVIFAC